ncbi:MAG: DUF3078 domain-containing protein [Bacteroidetes bacterium]|nr:DUF3078 domain-containing protein [Bacteroidota bacterium]
MIRRLLTATVLTLATFNANAQLGKTDDVKKSLESENKDTVAWLKGGQINIGFNEGFLHNWAAGGELASISLNGLFNGYVTRLYHRQVWSNNLDLNYGLMYAYSNNMVARKTDDRIDFTSKYGVRIDTTKNFYLTALFNFKSQFTKGYDYSVKGWDTLPPTSKFLSPAYFTLALGVEYRKGSDLSLFLSPVAARLTVADVAFTSRAAAGAYGVDSGKTTRMELGAYFTGRYMVSLSKNITYKTRLDLYSNYLAKDTKNAAGVVVKKDNPGNIDILWDNLLLVKISKLMNVTVGLTMIYDNDFPYSDTYVDKATGATVKKDEPGQSIGWIQMKQIFTLGFSYKF